MLKLNEAMSIVKVTRKIRMAPGNPTHVDVEGQGGDSTRLPRCNLVIDQLGGNQTSRSFFTRDSCAQDRTASPRHEPLDRGGHQRHKSSPVVAVEL